MYIYIYRERERERDKTVLSVCLNQSLKWLNKQVKS